MASDEIIIPRAAGAVRFLRVFLGRPSVAAGTVVVLGFVVAAVFAPALAPYDPNAQDLPEALRSPSGEHPFGTDPLGRDVLSRVIFGARISLIVGFSSIAIAAGIGAALGLAAGYLRGIADTVAMRVVDALMAVPNVILALALGAVLGGGLRNLLIALGIAFIPPYARLMRGQVLVVREADYVRASELIGAKRSRTMAAHVLPNCVSPLIVLVTLNVGVAILAAAGLSFLGLGVDPPHPAWGAMVSEGYRYLTTNPTLAFVPGLAIMLVVLALNIVGDGLRDTLDPRLRGTR